MSPSPIKLYYFKTRNLINFGDDLSPLLVEMVTGRKTVWAHPTRCELAGLGSILQRLVKHKNKRWLTAFGRKISVWGSGFIQSQEAIKVSDFDFLAVRGPSTAALVRGLDKPVFGDPGLLIGQLATKPQPKKFQWGIIPHYNDMDNPLIKAMLENTKNATLISVREDPIETLYKIKSCERILSSSLHGLIAADALEIPNWRLRVSDKIMGGDFKFNDYADAIGRTNISPIILTNKEIPGDQNLDVDSFAYFKNIAPQAEILSKVLLTRF